MEIHIDMPDKKKATVRANAGYDVYALGQVIDTTFTRPSTSANLVGPSVKSKIVGERLVITYTAVVNYSSVNERYMLKERAIHEADSVIDSEVARIKREYKKIADEDLKIKFVGAEDTLQTISAMQHNPRRIAYVIRTATYDFTLS